MLADGGVPFSFPQMGHMRWTLGRLAGCDYCAGGERPTLWSVDREGNREGVAFSIPGADATQVWDVAARPDGSLVAVGLATSGDSRMASFLAWISPDKEQQVVTPAWPYTTDAVTVAPDGTIWTVGEMENNAVRMVYPNVLRHYTTSGQLLASTKVTGVHKNEGGRSNVSMTSALMASNDRVGWLTAACQYIEFSLEAVQLGSYDCPNGYKQISNVSGVGLISADELLVGGKWFVPLAPLELDRSEGSWRPVPVPRDSGNTREILGFDGLTLVTNSTSSSMRRYTRSDPKSTAIR